MIPLKIKKIFRKFREDTHHLDYGRDVIVSFVKKDIRIHCGQNNKIKVLDIGVGAGTDLKNIQKCFNKNLLELYGIDSYEPNTEKCKSFGLKVTPLNIEYDTLPFRNETFDIIIANQVIEHTKEIFFIFSELSRVIKKGGYLIIGVPNLAALHNRILLLFGEHPPCINILGPHVRAFTKKALKDFVETDGYFSVKKVKGSNFYPFPPKISPYFSKIFPTLSISLFFLCQRTSQNGTFIDVLNTRFYETPYFRG